VLGGSVSGGRRLGYTLAAASFFVINYYFQAPYDSIWVGKLLDFVTLAAFLLTAVVATQLLDRARVDRDKAVRRADEVDALSRLGSESLSAARAGDAVLGVAEMIRASLGAASCDIVPGAPDAHVLRGDPRVMVQPLEVHGHAVGTMVVRFVSPRPFREGERTFIDALTHYAALALERERLAAEVERAESLRQGERMREFVLASVSHDLRTPLASIKALAQEEQRTGTSRAADIEQHVDRLARLVAELLDLSRLRARSFPLAPELNAAEDVIGAAVRQCTSLAEGKHLAAPLDSEAPPLYGTFDYVQTLRILVNLIENALRYTPLDGSVEVQARREGSELVIAVLDRGPGIAESERERVFDAFYRPGSAAPDQGRAGLGLAIARSLAEAQGGSVRFVPREGGGSVFEVRLPAADVDAAQLEES
ncbi:MAG: DUF4118 domain-containing protein, partial [Gemmatimonadetes bacterium]|nr:DUF4118 domain-containing protein [Gemmatimonadota bacterium]